MGCEGSVSGLDFELYHFVGSGGDCAGGNCPVDRAAYWTSFSRVGRESRQEMGSCKYVASDVKGEHEIVVMISRSELVSKWYVGFELDTTTSRIFLESVY